MAIQKIFQESYVAELKGKLSTPEGRELYSGDYFPYNVERTKSFVGIQQPEGLLDSLSPSKEDDFDTAVKIFTAFSDLTPIAANLKGFWAYLTHVDLFPYVQKRWPAVLDKSASEKYILDHWFLGNLALEHSLATHWWSVYLSIDEDKTGDARFDLTKVLYHDQDMRIRTIGAAALFRYRPAARAVLRFILDYKDLFTKNFEGKTRYINRFLNALSGSKLMTAMDEDFFYENLKSQITTIQSLDRRSESTSSYVPVMF